MKPSSTTRKPSRSTATAGRRTPVVAAHVLSERTGRLPAELLDWPGVRLHRLTFHGPGANTAADHRRAIISHLVPAAAEFHPANVDRTYSRYRRVGDMSMDESFLPIVWTREGGRSAWLGAQDLGAVLAQPGH
jgi:hypothetical protein